MALSIYTRLRPNVGRLLPGSGERLGRAELHHCRVAQRRHGVGVRVLDSDHWPMRVILRVRRAQGVRRPRLRPRSYPSHQLRGALHLLLVGEGDRRRCQRRAIAVVTGAAQGGGALPLGASAACVAKGGRAAG